VKEKRRVGRYDFAPAEEMQHDTSPHDVEIGGRKQRLQCASLILCYSRRQYAQLYPNWTRFECRCFLSEAIQYLGGAAKSCMVDNLSVVMARGNGKNAVPAAEIDALAKRFGFSFVAHELGDTNRSAVVERPFHHVENNFYPGRTFDDLTDLNQQLREWCDRNFRRWRRRLQASPAEVFPVEQPLLRPLPIYIPEVYALHSRRVDTEGYVNLHTNRYSVDTGLIGKRVEVRETIDRIRVFDGHRLAEEHDKQEYRANKRLLLPKHRGQWRTRRTPRPPTPIEALLREQGPELDALIEALRKRHGGRAKRAVGTLHRIWRDYPNDAVRGAVAVALEYGLTDVRRIEKMVLERIAGDFFHLPTHDDEPNDKETPDGR
jgi:hypothetical protein